MILLPSGTSSLDPLRNIYDWAKRKGFKLENEQIIIHGIPVQFIPAYNDLIEEAVKSSLKLNYEEEPVFVISPEYLAAIMVQTGRAKDKERLIRFYDEANISNEILDKILQKFNLLNKFKKIFGNE